MKKRYLIIAVILLSSVIIGCAAPSSKTDSKTESADNKKALDVINNYIQKKVEEQGGVYTIKGIRTKSYFLHNKVREKDGLLVSCVDFRTAINIYDVDFYIRVKDEEYIVIKELLHRRNGIVINEVLWQQN